VVFAVVLVIFEDEEADSLVKVLDEEAFLV
jgi:hypothetical protein